MQGAHSYIRSVAPADRCGDTVATQEAGVVDILAAGRSVQAVAQPQLRFGRPQTEIRVHVDDRVMQSRWRATMWTSPTRCVGVVFESEVEALVYLHKQPARVRRG